MLEHAYALLHVKQLDAPARTVSGLATTPELDRQGHTLDPAGARYAKSLPFLLHHNQREPIGNAQLQAPTADGIPFTATLATVAEPGALRERLEEAWLSIREKLITGVSIGFRILDGGIQYAKDGTARITKYEIVELSLVTIPANMSASILSVKSLAALGPAPTSPGVSGFSVVRLRPSKEPSMTIREHIKSLEVMRGNKSGRMLEIAQKSADDGATLNEQQAKEYDDLGLEVKNLDADLARMRDLEQVQIKTATPVVAAAGTDPAAASAQRGGHIQVKSMLPAGTAFVRASMALLRARGNDADAVEYAKAWKDTTPEVEIFLKSQIAAGSVTTDPAWAGALVTVQNVTSEFLELLRPATILGKIPGLRQVPFNASVPVQTSGGSYGWVGQQAPKPVTSLGFGTATLGMSKAAGIIVLTEELVRLSNPSAEAIVRADMIAGIAAFLDQQFIDPAVAPVPNISPGSITNGIAGVASTGNPLADLHAIVAALAGANIPLAGLVLIMSETNALTLGMQRDVNGNRVFPALGSGGGSMDGISVVTSNAANGWVIGVQPSAILYADDGGVTIDVSREASVIMDNAPGLVGPGTMPVSLWQNNLVGLRAERFVNWKRGRDLAVHYITGAAYTPVQAPAGGGALSNRAPEPGRDPGRKVA